MTTPSIEAKVEYPTLPALSNPQSAASLPSPADPTDAKNISDPVVMTSDDMNRNRDAGWFTSLNLNGQMPDGSDDVQNASTFNAQTAISWLSQRYRPWTEFFNMKKFGLPKVDIVIQRVQQNLSYFLSNYMCISIVLLIYCILTSFILLLAFIALIGLFYTIRQRTLKGPVLVAGNQLPPSLLYTLAIIVVIPLFYMADASGIIGYVAGTSIFFVILHTVLYISEEIPGAEFEVVTIA